MNGVRTYNRCNVLLQIVKVELASVHCDGEIKTGWKSLALSYVTGFGK